MRLSFVSDVHGNIDGLAEVARSAEQLVVLGDLVDYVDYHEPSRGILGRIFGAERVLPFVELRSAGRFPELRQYNNDLWLSLDDPIGVLSETVSELYRSVLAAIGPDVLLTLGNVDVAEAWNAVAGDELPYLDSEVVEIAGHRLGFVAGGAGRDVPGGGDAAGVRERATTADGSPRVWRPLVRPAAEYRAAVAAVGAVDILCSHLPPDLVPLRYDTVPARLESSGPGLLEAIDEHQPALSVFGHVHQPLARRQRRGRTECVNVGHFQRFPRAFEVDLTRLPRR